MRHYTARLMQKLESTLEPAGFSHAELQKGCDFMKVSSTEVQNNFGKYLKIAIEQEEVIINKNGRDVVRLVALPGVVSEEACEYRTPGAKWVTYEEFLELTENSDQRYELIDGELICMSSPNYFHQYAVDELHVILHNWFKGKKCRPVTSPFDITLPKSKNNINVVQPDIVVICDPENLDEKGRYKGIPVLVVEVVSESNKRYDMIIKLDLYMKTGIREYWLVDPSNRLVSIFTFENKDLKDNMVFTENTVAKSSIFQGLEFNVAELFGFNAGK